MNIKVLASNSIRAVMEELVPQFERSSRMSVSVSYDPAKVMLARIAKGDTGDLAITGSGAIDELVKQGKILPASRRVLARCRVGVAVRVGVNVAIGVFVTVAVAVRVAVDVEVGTSVSVAVEVGAAVSVGVAVALGSGAPTASANVCSRPAP